MLIDQSGENTVGQDLLFSKYRENILIVSDFLLGFVKPESYDENKVLYYTFFLGSKDAY